jgi:hypothetical protein
MAVNQYSLFHPKVYMKRLCEDCNTMFRPTCKKQDYCQTCRDKREERRILARERKKEVGY